MNIRSHNNRRDFIGNGIVAGFSLALIGAVAFQWNLGISLSLGLPLGVVGGTLLEIIQGRRARG